MTRPMCTSLTRRYARSILDTKKIVKVESKRFRTAVESPPSDQSLKRYRPLKRRRGRIFRHSVQTQFSRDLTCTAGTSSTDRA